MQAETARHITLLIPGLCPGGGSATFLDKHTRRYPALEQLLSRSQPGQRSVKGLDECLVSHFDFQYPGGVALPVAALTCLVDIEEPDAGYILRADPIHLRADQSTLRLYDSRTFPITQDEADALVAAFNEFYSGRGWRLSAPCPQRWYLYLPDVPLIKTVSPESIAGQGIDPNLPHGRDADAWRAIMNEVQMLFHRHPVNVRREQSGEPMINSLWFWGEGRLPEVVHSPDMQVATDYSLAMGLAHFTQTPRRDLPGNLEELLAMAVEAPTLLVLDELDAAACYTDVEAWQEAMQRLEQHWFAPLLAALGDARLASLEIDPCNGRSYRTTRGLQRRFWKRVHPLADVCQHD